MVGLTTSCHGDCGQTWTITTVTRVTFDPPIPWGDAPAWCTTSGTLGEVLTCRLRSRFRVPAEGVVRRGRDDLVHAPL